MGNSQNSELPACGMWGGAAWGEGALPIPCQEQDVSARGASGNRSSAMHFTKNKTKYASVSPLEPSFQWISKVPAGCWSQRMKTFH